MIKRKLYVVAPGRIASHSKENKDYHEGQVIDLSHLSDEQVAAVIASGVVVEKEEKKEAANG